MAIPANVRIGVPISFPAQVFGSGPVTLTKLNGVYTIGLSVDGLTTQTPPPGNFTSDFVPFYDSVQKTWLKSSLFDLQFQGTLPVSRGGTNGVAASGTLLDNITGFSATGVLVRTGAGTYAFRTITAGAGITVTNGDGIAGAPTVALTDTIVAGGPAGDATHAPVITWNSKGQLISVTAAATGLTANGTAAVGHLPGIASNAAAAAGEVGEFITSSVANTTVSLTSGVAANITSIILTPGDWDVWANLITTGNASTTVGNIAGSISITTGTFDSSDASRWGEQYGFNLALYSATYGTSQANVPAGKTRLLLNATTTVFLIAASTFATSTSTAGGTISARRRR